jgi:L-alanine-DL-glutamate epimerase-like enolase superfamily enzyme
MINKRGGFSLPRSLKRKYNMVILEKDNNKRIAMTREEAQKHVDDGYKVIKNKLGGEKIVASKTKKKKKKK